MPVTDPNAKPYDFVPLHPEGKQVAGVSGHERWLDLTGGLTCILRALTPLHVASGMIVTIEELRALDDIEGLRDCEEALILAHFRVGGKRVIPATSLKGSIRSLVEAISRSCVPSVNKRRILEPRGQDTSFSKSQACRVDARRGRQARLCPACRLFGAMGFEGKVRFHDALQTSGGARVALRPAPNQPNRDFGRDHRVHRDKYHRQEEDGNWYVKGRKFYHRFGQPEDQVVKYEPVEVCNRESVFTFQIDFENLSEAEVGLLLMALGQGNAIPPFALGGSRPFGYGSVEIAECSGVVWREQDRKKQCLIWDETTAPALDWPALREASLEQARSLVVPAQLERLQQILSEDATQREHNAEDIARWRQGRDRYE